MNGESSLGKRLLLEEERARIESKVPSEPNTGRTDKEMVEHTVFAERKDFSEKTAFTPTDERTTMPIKGVGNLKQFLLISDSTDYKIVVELDGRYILDDTYSYLLGNTNEIIDVSAYDRDGKNILSLSDYPFKESLNISINPNNEINFSLMRLTVKMKEMVSDV